MEEFVSGAMSEDTSAANREAARATALGVLGDSPAFMVVAMDAKMEGNRVVVSCEGVSGFMLYEGVLEAGRKLFSGLSGYAKHLHENQRPIPRPVPVVGEHGDVLGSLWEDFRASVMGEDLWERMDVGKRGTSRECFYSGVFALFMGLKQLEALPDGVGKKFLGEVEASLARWRAEIGKQNGEGDSP